MFTGGWRDDGVSRFKSKKVLCVVMALRLSSDAGDGD